VDLEIKTADELVDAALEARWAARRADRQGEVLQAVLRAFLAREGPVPVEDIEAALAARSADMVRDALAALDAQDLILLRGGRIELAYPFSGIPTDFTVVFPDGRTRHACCAIDALGIASMLGTPIRIRSRCHDCRAPLELTAEPEGPGPEAAGIMVWVGRWGEGARGLAGGPAGDPNCRVADSL